MLITNRRTALLGALGLVLYVAGCGPASNTQSDAGGPAAATANNAELHRGNGSEPQSLDPHFAQSTWENNIIGDLLVGLATEDAEGKPIPGAAASWDVSPDGLTWTFHLRDHTWSDGTPVASEDFLYAWRRILDPKTASSYAYFLYPIKNAEAVNSSKMPGTALGATAPDAKTLVLQLEHPAPYLVQFMTHYSTFAIPRHVVEAKGGQWTKPGSYIGNGAYTLTEWVPNDHVTLVKNPRFYDAANVKIERVIFHATSDYEAGLRRFRAGEIDTQTRAPGQQIGWIKANMPEVMNNEPVLSSEYYAVNSKRKPFDDVRVREALSLALDRETLTGTLRKSGEPPAYAFVPPGIANYPHTAQLSFKDMSFPERLARAQELMRQVGYGPDKPLKTSLLIRSASADARRIPAAVQQMWRKIYVDAEIQQNDAAIFYGKVQQHDFNIANAAWRADFNDASNYLDLLRTGNSNNYGQYSNPAYDALLNRADDEVDLEKRGDLLNQAEAMMLRDHALIPESFWVATALVRPYVRGWVTNPTEINRTRWLWLERPAERQQ
jgi:oligopeptide transport system substrate-binding protein